eukprot:gene7402-8188_t
MASTATYQDENQENICYYNNNKAHIAEGKNKTTFTKDAKQAGGRSRGGFNKILKDVTNQLREEWDEQVATEHQVDEAVVLVEEWMMEQKDMELAKKLAKAFEDEAKAEKDLDTIKGEAAAIQAAVEERRRLQAQAKARADQERADAELAKRLLDEEENESKLIFEMDAKFAASLADCVTPVKVMPEEEAEEKKHDTPCSEDLYEHKAFMRTKELEEDFEVARAQQKAWQLQEATERFRQNLRDYELSRRIVLNDYRGLFEQRKRKEMEACYEKCVRDEASVARLWEDAEAEVEDVHGAVALTLLLPNIKKLTVTLLKNGKTLRIEAVRLPLSKSVEVTPANASFLADFVLEGGDLLIQSKDVRHVYSSETGLLHVYIDDVNIDYDSKCDMNEQRPLGSFFQAVKSGLAHVFKGKKA